MVPVNVKRQSLPTTETVKFPEVPTVCAQLASVRVALALGALTTEIAESVETAKTKDMNEEMESRNPRMKVARLAAIPVCFLSAPVGDYPICNQEMPELMEH